MKFAADNLGLVLFNLSLQDRVMPHAHYFQHVPFEGLGAIEPWLLENGYSISHTPFYESSVIPPVDAVDFLIIMGGPMSINDETIYPWLVTEKAYIREFIQTGKPILGVCLGAQLIASASGAQVYKNPQPEIGWFPIQPIPVDAADIFQFEPELGVFHWHGETFDLPEGATWLATSEACLHQAFSIGPKIVGLQFHIETTTESASALVEHCSEELIPGTYVQSASEIMEISSKCYAKIHEVLGQLLTHLTKT